MNAQDQNLSFLEAHDPQLVRLGALAERYFADDPNSFPIKSPQYGEAFPQVVARISSSSGFKR